VLGANVVDGVAVAVPLRVRVLNGTVVPSRKQFLMCGQPMSRVQI
jgi:hypothetical protein